ncbi:MAG: DNA translocase FtsK [Clostridia bacterium]
MKKDNNKTPYSNAKKNGNVKKKVAGSAKTASYKQNEAETLKMKPETKREILGIVFIAFGILLAIFIYSLETSVIGSAVVTVSFGLIGVFSYCLPPLFLLFGLLRIIKSEATLRKGAIFSALICIFLIITIIHSSVYPLNGSGLIAYYGNAFNVGSEFKSGGGLFGALLSYPFLLLLGNIGTLVLLIALTIITALISTRLSLKSMSKRVKMVMDKNVQKITKAHEEKRASISKDVIDFPDLFLQNDPNESADFNLENIWDGKRKKSKKLEKSAHKVDLWDGELDFLPLEGPLKTKDEAVSPEKNFSANHDIDIEAINRELGTDKIPLVPDIPDPVIVTRPHSYEYPNPEPLVPFKPEENAIESDKIDLDAPVSVPYTSYQCPPVSFLNPPEKRTLNTESPSETAKLLINTLASFKIAVRITNVTVGPVVTRYEMQPAQGVRVSRITSLSNDLALALAAPRVRIEAPIPGKAAIGIEVPNKCTSMVYLRELIESNEFKLSKSPLTFALGKDIAGKTVVGDLQRMPHLLIAGATGAGKSVCVNDIIISMIYKSSPEELRMILIDPKVVEFQVFAGLPHLLIPVVTDVKKAAGALHWAVNEMEQRYKAMAKLNARDLDTYNLRLGEDAEKLPRIVVIIDELADLMMVAAKEIEESICRIAQLGRACGIHLIVATQRPSVDVITGLIKANIPSRIAFMVSSSVDSRVILDGGGAEKLLGRGDMLFHANGDSKPTRVQCSFITIDEVEKIIEFFGVSPEEHKFNAEALIEIAEVSSNFEGEKTQNRYDDELLPEAVQILLDTNQASISMLQRRLRVGYARAARLIDIMEQRGIVSSYDGSKPRKLLIDYLQYRQMFGVEYSPIPTANDDIIEESKDNEF